MASPDDDTRPGGELQEDRKQRHAIRLLLSFVVRRASACCSSDFGILSLKKPQRCFLGFDPIPVSISV